MKDLEKHIEQARHEEKHFRSAYAEHHDSYLKDMAEYWHGYGNAMQHMKEMQARRTKEIQEELRQLREQEESMETGSERNIEYEDLLIQIAELTGELKAYGYAEDRNPEELEIIY